MQNTLNWLINVNLMWHLQLLVTSVTSDTYLFKKSQSADQTKAEESFSTCGAAAQQTL